MEKENYKRNTENFMTNQENFMLAFRSNVERFAKDNNLTIKNLSEMSDLSFATLNSFLYGNAKDCKLSTAIKLSTAFGISLDELVGAETIPEEMRNGLNIVRNFPKRTQYMIHWLLKYHQKLMAKQKSKNVMHIMKPQVRHGEGIYVTNHFAILDITDCKELIAPSVFISMYLPGEVYMPKYAPGDILLLARGGYNETGVEYVMIHEKRIYIVKKEQRNGIEVYSDIVNPYFSIAVGEEDKIVGYIVNVLCEEQNGLREVRGTI
jgi:hypothetical protein